MTNVIPLIKPNGAAPSTALGPEELRETVFVERLADALRGRFAYTDGMGWLEWSGRVWSARSNVAVREATREFIRDFTEVALDDDGVSLDYGELLKRLGSLNTAAKVNALTDLARGLLIRDAGEFDADPDVINCANGLLHLDTMELEPHDPAMLVTRCTDVDYVPGAEHPDWTAALAALGPDERFKAWYMLRKGQAITGHVADDDLVLIEKGDGSNGKSTIVEAITAALGDYFTPLSDKVLLGRPEDHSTELMSLRGVRYAQIEETPKARTLDTQRLKKLAGTGTLTARALYKDNITFATSHTLFVNTNYPLVVNEVDDGTWRRLALVPFTQRYRKLGDGLGPMMANDVQADTGVRERLKAGEGAEAVLAWLVQGAHAWYAVFGRRMPETPALVQAATRKWRTETDTVLQLLDELLEIPEPADGAPTPYIVATDLVQAVNAWLSAHGHQGSWTAKLCASRFGDHPEVRGRGVAQKQVRADQQGLARSVAPAGMGGALWHGQPSGSPARSMAWIGLRFRP